MLRTIEAEITTDGTVILLEPIEVTTTTHALVTVMENGSASGNVAGVISLMKTSAFQNRRSFPADEIEKQIEDERDAWE